MAGARLRTAVAAPVGVSEREPGEAPAFRTDGELHSPGGERPAGTSEWEFGEAPIFRSDGELLCPDFHYCPDDDDVEIEEPPEPPQYARGRPRMNYASSRADSRFLDVLVGGLGIALLCLLVVLY